MSIRRKGAAQRKALQLCSQVAQTLHGALQGECGDDCLRDLLVEAVEPFPNAGRLLVTVSLSPAAAAVPLAEILEHLERARGLLRSEVAAAVCRRKVPELVFRVRPRAGDAV